MSGSERPGDRDEASSPGAWHVVSTLSRESLLAGALAEDPGYRFATATDMLYAP
ncbi:MAG: hypothetical protein AAGC55_22970 [Myxococcota bacterium]